MGAPRLRLTLSRRCWRRVASPAALRRAGSTCATAAQHAGHATDDGHQRRLASQRPHDAAVAAVRPGRQVGRRSLPLLVELREVFNREPTADKLYSLAELAYISGRKAELTHPQKALELYGAAVLHSYMYLFDDRFAASAQSLTIRNSAAPATCTTATWKASLRIIKQDGALKPGTTHLINAASHSLNMTIALRGEGWQADDFERFEFVSDYEIKGLKNQYHTYGLGVPLIAVRRNQARQTDRALLSAGAEPSRHRLHAACCPTGRRKSDRAQRRCWSSTIRSARATFRSPAAACRWRAI